MCGGLEAKLRTFKNTNNHAFPESTGLGMSLESLLDRNHMGVGINVRAKAFTMPGAIGIIDLQVTFLGGRRRLLKGIGGVGNRDNQTLGGCDSKEEAHARLLNAGGICLCKLS